ncbi:MAG: CPBP family intramembrane metalloprotease [Desulfobacteraceae bacterium]|nr:CPBP family intramembrane metalloprotease [Desulfobacteraceae bacterium]
MTHKSIKLEPFSKKANTVFHVVLVIAAAAGLVFFILQYDNVSPMASVDFKISRNQAVETAEIYFREMGYDLNGYERTIVFETDYDTSFYFEKTFGTAKANELMRTKAPTRYWLVRWFKPLQKEEFSLAVTPSGIIHSFSHMLSKDEPGAKLPHTRAREIAVSFLETKEKISLDNYEVRSSNFEKRDNRADHFFTWQDKYFNMGNAKLCMDVKVYGDKVGYFNRTWTDIPENFTRAFNKERSHARLLTRVSFGLKGILCLCSFFTMMWMYKHRTLQIRLVAWISSIIFLLLLLNILNYTPLFKNYYQTSQQYHVFFFNRLLSEIQFYFQFLLLFIVAALAGEAVSKEVWGGQKLLCSDIPEKWISLMHSSFRGICISLFGLGYITFFILSAKKLGAWYPLSEPYRNILNTRLPLLDPLLDGVFPAFSEETLSRLFSISFLLFLTKRKWPALVIPAVIWAFCHSWYLTSPVYLRGIELTVKGIIYGYIFMKFDIITVIMAHFSYNAVLGSIPLLRSDNLYIFSCGLSVVGFILLPLIPGICQFLKLKLSLRDKGQ